jgi:hypothetical protein
LERIVHRQSAGLADVSRRFSLVGRVLLALTLTLVVLIPWSESFCHFDQFLRGGQDFELGLLAFATLLCLVLVLLQQGGQGVRLLLGMQRWLSYVAKVARDHVAGMTLDMAKAGPRLVDGFSWRADGFLKGSFTPLRI